MHMIRNFTNSDLCPLLPLQERKQAFRFAERVSMFMVSKWQNLWNSKFLPQCQFVQWCCESKQSHIGFSRDFTVFCHLENKHRCLLESNLVTTKSYHKQHSLWNLLSDLHAFRLFRIYCLNWLSWKHIVLYHLKILNFFFLRIFSDLPSCSTLRFCSENGVNFLFTFSFAADLSHVSSNVAETNVIRSSKIMRSPTIII
jgi:hypothetical protein